MKVRQEIVPYLLMRTYTVAKFLRNLYQSLGTIGSSTFLESAEHVSLLSDSGGKSHTSQKPVLSLSPSAPSMQVETYSTPSKTTSVESYSPTVKEVIKCPSGCGKDITLNNEDKHGRKTIRKHNTTYGKTCTASGTYFSVKKEN